jgi:hypothetical protein
MAGYPRVIGAPYYPGVGNFAPGVSGWNQAVMHGYVAGADAPALPPGHPGHHHHHGHHGHHLPVHGAPDPSATSAPWRAMMAPGSPPLGEGHVPIPLNPETFGGSWGNTTGGGAPAGTQITFSARPQKPFKTSRLLIRGTKSGTTAIGNLIGQVYIGTDLQQGEVGNIDLESLGAANAFDTWVSFKQAEPGVWIRVLGTLTAFPTGTDFESYTVTAIGHYLH